MKLRLPATFLLACLMLSQSILGGCRCVLDKVLHQVVVCAEAESRHCTHAEHAPTRSAKQTCHHGSHHCPGHDCPGHDTRFPDHTHAPQATVAESKSAGVSLQLTAVFSPLPELTADVFTTFPPQAVPMAETHAHSPPLYLTLHCWLI